MRAYLTAIGLLLAIFGAIGGYLIIRFSALAAMDFSPPPVTVAAAEARRETWSGYLEAVGTIKARRGVELSAEGSGEVAAIHFESGDRVEKGALLAVLNDQMERASRDNRRAALKLAEILHERNSKLLEQASISQTRYDQSSADLAQARAALKEAEAQLDRKRIRAPFAGVIGIRRVEVGDYASPGAVIATLQDASELEIDFTLPARYAPRLKQGLAVQVRVDAFPERRFAAEIAALDARVDPATRNLSLRARMLETGGLLPGMFASMRVETDDARPVATVPETAVTYSLQGNVVYLVREREAGGLTAEARVVEVGEVRDGRAAVLSGIEGGEQVVTAGQNKLYRGVQIVIDESVRF